MKRNWVGAVQTLCITMAISLVVMFFIFGFPGGGEEPETTPEPTPSVQPSESGSPSPGPQPEDPSPQPGVPVTPIDQMATMDESDSRNLDRQLEYEGAEPSVELPAAPSDDLRGYWHQELQWEDCGQDECATALVPLDWDNPGRAALNIRMRRIASAEPSRGPLFVNPGGPGYGGQSFAQRLGQDAWAGYDIIGWDPRGTGESTTVQCGSIEQTDAAFEADATPDDEAQLRTLADSWAQFAQQCRDASGDLLDHLSTIENVRDLDLLRHLLGAEKLNYVGVSYGTLVGSVYAHLFPDRAGNLVLDSAVNITDDEEAPSQAEGFELALRNYAEWCAPIEACGFGSTADDVVEAFAVYLQGLNSAPLEVGDRMLTQSLATTGVALFLYADDEAYPALTYAVTDAMQGRGQALLQAADGLNNRGPENYGTEAFAFPATRCVDSSDRGLAKAFESWQELIPDSPVFAANMGMKPICEVWTADSGPQLLLTAEGAPPILVVGTTGDSATPYEHAVSMAEQLESGVLLTYDSAGHGAVTAGNACIDDAVTRYLLDGELPPEGTVCS